MSIIFAVACALALAVVKYLGTTSTCQMSNGPYKGPLPTSRMSQDSYWKTLKHASERLVTLRLLIVVQPDAGTNYCLVVLS